MLIAKTHSFTLARTRRKAMMPNRANSIKPVRFLAVILAACCVLPACKSHPQNVEPRDYLEQAFSDLVKNPPPSPNQNAQENIQRVISAIRETASRKKIYGLDPGEAAELGYSAFPAITPLLKDSDPWVRASTIAVLSRLDHKRSPPFLVGMMTDMGRIQYSYDDVFVDTTISRYAAGYLAAVFRGSFDIPTPPEEMGQPQAEGRARQRWYAYHLPYCSWKESVQGELCWLDLRALYSHVPEDELSARLKSDPEKFKYIPVVWPQVTDSTTRIFSQGQLIRVSLIYQNFGTQQLTFRVNPERGTHILRLIGPDGREVPATAKLNEFTQHAITPPVPPEYALGWTIDLNTAYDVSRPGYYRFYYSYLAPMSLRWSDFGETLDLQFWNGREYANYYDFVVKQDIRELRKTQLR
jgi:hypothetical protein